MKRIQAVSIEFKETQTPFSPIFQDFYYSLKDGIEETIHVYVNGSGFADSLKNKDQHHFHIGEIGFGVGLNFLITYRHFLKHSTQHQTLTFVSVEKHPVKLDGLQKLYALHPELKEFSDELIEQYPILTPGIHSLSFAKGRVRLILVLGDAIEMFQNMKLTPSQKIQHWYFDGFSPQKNPEAFDEKLFKTLIPLSIPNAKASSYTSSGWVRRALEAQGFKVEKLPGYGTKRELIHVTFPDENNEKASNEKPWFSSQNLKKLKSGDKIAVIGAGLSGSAIARALAERNFSVVLLDQDSIAAHASGNVVGLFNVQLSKLPNPISRYSQLSLTHFIREIRKLKILTKKGILRLDANREKENFDSALITSEYPEHFYEEREDGVFFPECGILNPKKLCETRADHPNIEFIKSKVQQVEKTAQGFRLINNLGEMILDCEHIVYATGASQSIDQYLKHSLIQSLPLRAIRGQIIHLSPTIESQRITCSLVDSGYITPLAPEISGINTHCVGATYQAKVVLDHQQEIDSLKLLQEAKEKHTAFSNMEESNILSSRAGYRLATPDKLPIIGPLCDAEKLKKQFFSSIRSGKIEGLSSLQAESGEWLFLGMGSRGITFSSYGAEILASLMCGDLLPIESDLWEHLHSARFIIRNLKKPEATNKNLR